MCNSIALAAGRPSRLAKPRTKRRGAAAVEFAVIAPLMFMLVLGLLEMGRAVMVSNLVINASREGARKACLSTMTVSEVDTWVKQYLQQSGVPSTAVTVSITNQSTTGGGYSTTSSLSGVSSGMGVEVTVSVPFSAVSWLPNNRYVSQDITGSTIMRKEAG